MTSKEEEADRDRDREDDDVTAVEEIGVSVAIVEILDTRSWIYTFYDCVVKSEGDAGRLAAIKMTIMMTYVDEA